MFYVMLLFLLTNQSAGGGAAESRGSGEDGFSVTEESTGRMWTDGGEKHQDRDAGEEREGVDSICTQVHNHLVETLPWFS